MDQRGGNGSRETCGLHRKIHKARSFDLVPCLRQTWHFSAVLRPLARGLPWPAGRALPWPMGEALNRKICGHLEKFDVPVQCKDAPPFSSA
jgi:hypothetical protein